MEKKNQRLRVLLYEAEIWVPDVGERHKSFFQNFLMQGPLVLSLYLRLLEGKKLHLPSLSTFSPVHQSQKVALCDDKYSLSLPAEARVLRCKRKNSIAGKAFLNFILKNKKALNIPGGDFPLIGSYCFLEKPLVFKSILKHTLRKCSIAVGHLACNQSILSV